jgi:hypothetical protein
MLEEDALLEDILHLLVVVAQERPKVVKLLFLEDQGMMLEMVDLEQVVTWVNHL